ncbi:hypothetical protein [Aquella oligotrophica]|uniref:Uncharacterized protein n=1 Tax=Aquella oligotrophica TaxID=2067065 RepID=A0A2I7N6E4_9NEIS|nr:hypothetical protein [Aquella oligotrophica]AUR52047.1 hypothetical protein CUN60_06955 [Aquella oligotrophica]
MNKRLLILLNLITSLSYTDPTMDQQEQINQALINARSRIDFNKVKEQQEQQNRDNQLAIRISEITEIPSWRNIVFIRQARNVGRIDAIKLINVINQFLIQNEHPKLNQTQLKQISSDLQSYHTP